MTRFTSSNPPIYSGGGRTIISLPGIDNLSPAGLAKLVSIADQLGTDPDYLATVIKFEGGFKTTAKNPFSGATGLIQFMPSTARALGTTTDELAKMTDVDQLDYVYKYLHDKGNVSTLERLYLAIFYPKAMGMNPDDIIAYSGDPVYEQNKGFDTQGNGYIRRSDITSTIHGIYASHINSPRLVVPDAPELQRFWKPFLVITALLGAGYAYRQWQDRKPLMPKQVSSMLPAELRV